MKGLIFVLVLVSAIVAAMRVAGSTGEFPVMMGAGIFSGIALVCAIIAGGKWLNFRKSLWHAALAGGLIAILGHVWPREYSDALGWTYVAAFAVGLISTYAIHLFRQSKAYERTR